MRRKTLVLIMIAAGCGLVVTIGVSQMIEDKSDKDEEVAVETVDVFVTNAHIKVTDILTEELVVLEQWPRDRAPEGILSNWDDIQGRRPTQPMFKGEAILQQKLVDSNDITGAADRIRKGYRALPVKVTAEMTSGLLQPGDMVDVLVVFRQGGGISRTVAKTILENVPVFAVNEHIIRNTDIDGNVIQAKTVTLEVTPNQAERLTLAMKMGDLSLSIRPPDDVNSVEGTDGTGIGSLLGLASETVEPLVEQAVAAAAQNNDFMKFATSGGRPELPTLPPAEDRPRVEVWGPEAVRLYEIDPEGGPPREIMLYAEDAADADTDTDDLDSDLDGLDEAFDEEDDDGLGSSGEFDIPGFSKELGQKSAVQP